MAAVQAAGPDPMMTTFSGMADSLGIGGGVARGVRTILDGERPASGPLPSAEPRGWIGTVHHRTVSRSRLRAPCEAASGSELPMQQRLTHFREILRYVPRFRDRVFVIAVDGAVVEDENFPNLLLDIALLRSLSIRVVLAHGAAHQVRRFADVARVTPSDVDGTGITDKETLQVAITA